MKSGDSNFATDRVAKPTSNQPVATQQSPPLAALVDETTGHVYPLLAAITTIGRDKTCAIMLAEDAAVSRRHAQVLKRGVSFVVEDLGSANGVKVNGEKIAAPRELHVGDRIEIGSRKFQFKRRA